MSNVQVAVILLAVVISVIVATRPAPPRRRRTRSTRPPDSKTGPNGRRPPVVSARRRRIRGLTTNGISRNHWDRPDLAAGVGHTHELADVTLSLWPSLRPGPR